MFNMAIQNVACGDCGTMVTFSIVHGEGHNESHKEIKDTGTGDPPSGMLSALKNGSTKEKDCPNCDSTVWIQVQSMAR